MMKIEEAIVFCLASSGRGMRTQKIAHDLEVSKKYYMYENCSTYKRWTCG